MKMFPKESWITFFKKAGFNKTESWFNGGAVAPTTFSIEGQLEILFDPQDSEGSAFFESKIKLEPGGESEDDEYDIESTYIQPFVKDSKSWGFQMDLSIVEEDNGIFKTQVTLINKRVGSDSEEDKLWISEISPSRTEVRLFPIKNAKVKYPELEERYALFVSNKDFRDDTIIEAFKIIEQIEKYNRRNLRIV